MIKPLLKILNEDAYRYTGKNKTILHCYRYFPGYKYSFWLRCTQYFSRNKRSIGFIFSRILLSRYKYKFAIDIPYTTQIGSGLYIGHFSGIFISSDAVIGKNFNISQCVTIGSASRGEKNGTPVIGDSVYIAPGAKVFGAIVIESNVAIGANAVVSSDVSQNSVVVGIPASTISNNGSRGYCVNEV
ncbi:serine O-acetyltransferase [Psychrobium sp. 1_MG-2023]|uniref:serine O-acetyltransferase n=1 Tax=Psychrobium sp. 1_MG-2023 TaxID=3062624 RepID=UPI0026972E1F|nr:serine acetyltransferase [Psychrobium sp. 1_MG-2023]MDP2562086.1 serine acetyltransferase [Psychrobium sp. 1_MG-2023]